MRTRLTPVLALTLAAFIAGVAIEQQGYAKSSKASATPSFNVIKMNSSSEGKNIVEVAIGSKDHSTLVAAVKAADLVETLTGAGPYTLFAPTNAAFDKLPKGTVENLLKPENKGKLAAILEHHAAAPRFTPELLITQSSLDMADGGKIAISYKDGKIFADGVEVKAIIAATNGMVYVVDSVILAK